MLQLQEDPSDENIQSAFDAWLNEDPANKQAWLEVSRTTDVMFETIKEFPRHNLSIQDIEKNRLTTTSKISILSDSHGLSDSISIKHIAALIGVFILGTMLLSHLPQAILFAKADHSTQTGQSRRITLADGSHVILGAKSAIDVDFKAEHRQVRLLAGQAFFEVKKDPSRPFVVLFENNQTLVTGTAFEVNMSLSSAIISVDHGSVRVSPQKLTQLESSQLESPMTEEIPFKVRALSKGESVQINHAGNLKNYDVKPEYIAAWRNDRLVVADRSVRDVINELKRHYKGLVVNGLGAIGDKRISGIYDLKDPVKVLQTIAATHGAKVRQLSNWIIVLSLI